MSRAVAREEGVKEACAPGATIHGAQIKLKTNIKFLIKKYYINKFFLELILI